MCILFEYYSTLIGRFHTVLRTFPLRTILSIWGDLQLRTSSLSLLFVSTVAMILTLGD